MLTKECNPNLFCLPCQQGILFLPPKVLQGGTLFLNLNLVLLAEVGIFLFVQNAAGQILVNSELHPVKILNFLLQLFCLRLVIHDETIGRWKFCDIVHHP